MNFGGNNPKKLVFFGNERLVSGLEHTDTPILSGLVERGYDIIAVVSHHTQELSRKKRPLEVTEVATAHAIPLFTPTKLKDIYKELAGLHADAAVLVAYGQIIPQSVIDLFPLGIINIHPSLLPLYRGPTPIESAIANDDPQTGVSIMQLAAGMDSGPVYAQKTIPLTGRETKFDLYQTVKTVSADLLFTTLPGILDGRITPKPQQGEPTYCPLLQKTDAWLNINHLTAAQADAKVRAHLGYPKTKAIIGEHTVIITKGHVSKTARSPLDLACKDNTIYSIDELVAPSGKTMSASDFLRGYKL